MHPMIHPQFNPIAFSVGFFSVHWYGLMYLLAFILFIIVCRIQIKQQFKAALNFNHQDIEDILFFGAIGVILGGRLGYILFYKLNDYLAHPLDIVKIWQGGMSFHGGFLGVVLALIIWAKLHKKSILEIGDFVVPAVPLGLAAGRIGNFINGELWGRPTDPQAWWAMVFPQAGDITAHIARHPSQLYQAALEGIGLFIIVWLFARRTQIKQDTIKQDVLYGKISGVFIAGYGICRLIVEFAREPDSYLGLLNLGLSMGQWLSLPMIIIGGILYFRNSLYKYI